MQNQETKNPKKQPKVNELLRYSGMGLQMAAIMLLGAWGGSKLDELWDIKNNLLTALGTVLGVVVALYTVIKDLMKKKE